MNNVKQIFITDESSIASLRSDLDKAEFVAVMHHEPPKSLPYADRWDLLTIRTQDHAFHILPITDSSISRHAINVLQSFKGYVYARSPQGLHRILQEEYAWAPQFYDITPVLEEFVNKDTLVTDNLLSPTLPTSSSSALPAGRGAFSPATRVLHAAHFATGNTSSRKCMSSRFASLAHTSSRGQL